ncbi:LOW QUALITY PROTEIN: skin secretory protein xP2 [Phoca vitulina]|uniref:LOW QUALITY PROTEIN: skin secretory protein xP2 n=1 Tax=Phoca vitulina TaxID=9720 RepID=UPI001396208E|nr:LOW QUALITY PROTEIN: skin secretory protein xP2 [Phoca vitulina]
MTDPARVSAPPLPTQARGSHARPFAAAAEPPRAHSRAGPQRVAAGAEPPVPPKAETMPGRPDARRPGHRLGGTRSGPNETEPSSRRSRGRCNNGAPGRGRLRRRLSPTPARARARAPAPRGAAAGAHAPPAPLRSAPSGAQRSGPAPRPMGREQRAGGGHQLEFPV